jgi:hypothetical protein
MSTARPSQQSRQPNYWGGSPLHCSPNDLALVSKDVFSYECAADLAFGRSFSQIYPLIAARNGFFH